MLKKSLLFIYSTAILLPIYSVPDITIILYITVVNLKFHSWNVNGLRAVLKKDALAYLDSEQPDIFCIQETRASPEQIDPILPQYPHQYWNSAEKKGYAGTAVFSKIEPLNVIYDMNIPEHDAEGRLITLEFPEYYLVNVYTPNSGAGLVRLDYRMSWDRDFLKFIKELEQSKPVIFCGDLNVAHKEIDLANPESNHQNAGFTDEEREGFTQFLTSDFIDSFRKFNQEGGNYTWWSFRTRAREKNIGWRIDYFCLSEMLRPILKEAFILPSILGSDHCPIGIILESLSQR